MQPPSISESKRLLQRFGLDASSVQGVPNSISLPKLKYGYRTTKMNWPELFDIIEKEKDLAKLSRHETQQREYEIFRYYLKRQYQSVVDFILCSKFGHDRIRNDEDDDESVGLWKAHPPLSKVSNVKKVLVPNDFPYYTDDDIVHYVLWKTKLDITKEDIEDAQKELRTRLQLKEILHWVNPPHLKSLPEIDHVHFLCLLKEPIG